MIVYERDTRYVFLVLHHDSPVVQLPHESWRSRAEAYLLIMEKTRGPGRPRFGSTDAQAIIVSRIWRMRSNDCTYEEIARWLNGRREPTATGGPWRIGTIAAICRRFSNLEGCGPRLPYRSKHS